MTYPNAYKGIEKLHIAEIVLIIGSILEAIVSFIVSEEGMNIKFENMGTAMLIIIIVMVVVCEFMILYSDILNIVGLGIASRELKIFKIPLYLAIVLIAAQIAAGVFEFIYEREVVSEIVEAIGEVVELVQMILVIVGSSRLAKSLNGTKLVKLSRINLFLIVVMIVFSFVAGIVSFFVEDLYNVLRIISSVFELVSFVIYLGYIDRMIKFLKEN